MPFLYFSYNFDYSLQVRAKMIVFEIVSFRLHVFTRIYFAKDLYFKY